MIAGLGNPGSKYAETRHNAGFWFLDALAQRAGLSFKGKSRLGADVASGRIDGRECLLVRPQSYMNESGRPLRACLDYFRLPSKQLLVAYDELDLPPGRARLKEGGGHGGHNGLRDVFRHVPDHGFLRLRIGIGHPGVRDAVTPWVLSRPPREDERIIRIAIDAALDVIPMILRDDVAGAMTGLHTETG